MGLTTAQLEGLGNHHDNPAEFNEIERLVIRYAEQLTATAATDEALDADLRKHLSDRELVELAVTVATANATTRICNALKIEARRKTGLCDATPEELEGIDRGLEDARNGRFVTDAEVDAVFAKYRGR